MFTSAVVFTMFGTHLFSLCFIFSWPWSFLSTSYCICPFSSLCPSCFIFSRCGSTFTPSRLFVHFNLSDWKVVINEELFAGLCMLYCDQCLVYHRNIKVLAFSHVSISEACPELSSRRQQVSSCYCYYYCYYYYYYFLIS